MKNKNRKIYSQLHKWTGIMVCLFMCVFCISGLILNHRHMYSNVNVSRRWLPSGYQFSNWNNGLLRGTVPFVAKGSRNNDASYLIYGAGGIFSADSAGNVISDFNRELPASADKRNIRAIAMTSDSTYFSVSRFGVYRLVSDGWNEICSEGLPKRKLVGSDNDYTDIITKGDSLIVVSRSRIYIAQAPYNQFKEVQIASTKDFDHSVSLFRVIWMAHAGDLYGLPTKILSDLMAIILLIVSLTGIVFFVSKRRVKWLTRHSFKWHNSLGKWTIVLSVFIALTGWMLRPPVLLALVKGSVPAIPGSVLDNDNQWEDRLRMLRWDENLDGWLLSTADGIFFLNDLHATPKRVTNQPPVSVMGLNVFEREGNDWILGSFSGIYRWNPIAGIYQDMITNETTLPSSAPAKAGPPIGRYMCSGYTSVFGGKQIAVNYTEGTKDIPQPEEYVNLPMSLWSVALELHNGRCYPLCSGLGASLFIFIAGILLLICLLTGYLVRKR